MITKSCWNGAASGRFSGVGRSVPYAMGVFGNQRELAGNDAFPCGAGRSPPPTRELKVSATTRASGAQRSVCGADGRNRVESEAEIIPKVSINFGQSLSHGLRPCQLPLHKGAFGTGDADCRVASLLAMTVLILCHSEKAQRADVGIRPFLRWTGDGPPRSSAPTEGLPKPQQQAGVGIGPYGKPNPPPKPAGAQRSVRACGREGWAGIDARTISKWGPPPRLPGQRLAKRKARKEPLVKFSLCPMTSEFSTAQKVRKSDGSPARAHADVTSTE